MITTLWLDKEPNESAHDIKRCCELGRTHHVYSPQRKVNDQIEEPY